MKKLRLLVVDDDAMVRRSLARILRGTYEVTEAGSCWQAQAVLVADEGIDMVLCDVLLLQGSGMELYTWMLVERPDLAQSTVFMTGGTFTTASRLFLESVTNPRLYKPFDLDDLREALDKVSPVPVVRRSFR